MKTLFTLLFAFSAFYCTKCLDNGLGLTPPMGWLSWTRYACNIDCTKYPKSCINEQLYKDMADRMAEDGYKELGYQYVDIDDCWSEKQRDADGKLVADKKRFPNGMKALAEYVHSRGLKLGIYGDVGNATCAGYPSQNGATGEGDHYAIDAKTFADWDIDSFKFDGCNQDAKKMDTLYPLMAKALNDSGRAILYNCQWPMYQLSRGITPNMDEVIKYCNVFRIYRDVQDSWASVAGIIEFFAEHQTNFTKYNGAGHFYDPDMLTIGNFGLSYGQSITQMAFWALWSAPLYLSNDLRDLRPEFKNILQNKAVIEVNQDKLAKLGTRVIADRQHSVWVKQLNQVINGEHSYAVIYFFNATLGDAKYMSYPLSTILTETKNSSEFMVTDLFAEPGKYDLGKLKHSDNLELMVNPSGSVRMVKLVPIVPTSSS